MFYIFSFQCFTNFDDKLIYQGTIYIVTFIVDKDESKSIL